MRGLGYQRIHDASDVDLRTIRRAYRGQRVRVASWRRIVAAALALGIKPPGPIGHTVEPAPQTSDKGVELAL